LFGFGLFSGPKRVKTGGLSRLRATPARIFSQGSGQLNRLTGPRFRLGAALLGPLYTGSQAAFTLDRRNSLVLQATVNRKR